ncbi:MAG: nucleotide exchange factor GrpE [Myxococcales bacterium]|nr:nucleotide exchange factor GrpE [Myxococcales bacterium]
MTTEGLELVPPEPRPPSQGEAEARADPALRERILQRFTQWLDQALEAEAPPPGIASELLATDEPGSPAPDLHSLFSALTVLAQEVKLQGRAFQNLYDALAREEKERASAAEQARRGRHELLELLLDVRDRLERGLAAVSAQNERLRQLPARSGFFGFLGLSDARVPPLLEAAFALARGYELSLERLNEGLRRLHVEEIAAQGRPFDPYLMKAVGVVETSDSPQGSVVEVCRPGYRVAGELFRVAEVRVASASSANNPGGPA